MRGGIETAYCYVIRNDYFSIFTAIINLNNKVKKIYLILFFTTCLVFSLKSQIKNEIQIGFSRPLGHFANENNEDAIANGSGYAADGIFVGYKLLSPLVEKKLYWTLGASLSYHNLKKEFKDYFGNALAEELSRLLIGYGGPLGIWYPMYVNCPVFAGLQYVQPIAKSLSVFGDVGFGVNMLKITNFTMDYLGIIVRNSFDPSFKAAYTFGGGILIKDKISINLSYVDLGSHKVKYKTSSSTIILLENDEFSKPLPISTMNLSLGLRY